MTSKPQPSQTPAASNDLAAQISMASSDGLLAFDTDYRLTFWNTALERIYGVVSPEVIGRNVFDAVPVLRDERHNFERVLQGHAVHVRGTFPAPPSAGEACYEARYAPLEASDGSIVGGFTSVRDVTESIQTHERLLESEVRFRTMADCSPVLLWMAGVDGLCSYFNQVWLDFTGRTLGMEIGNGWAEGVHPEDFQFCMDTYLNAFVARREFRMEYRLRRADGQYRWLLDTGLPRYAPGGDFAGFIGSCIDITELREAREAQQRITDELEQRVQERTRELREQQARLAQAQEIAHLGNWTWDVATNSVAWSDELFRIHGLDPEAFAATYEGYLQRLHPEDVDRVKTVIEAALHSQRAFQFEARIVRPDGEARHVHSWGEVDVKEGEIVRLLGVCQDVTERKLAEQELAKRAEQLAHSNAELEHFAYVASHDLQEPLRMVASYVQLLGKRYKGKLDGDADDFIGYAVDGAARMQGLIQDLLAYSRVNRQGEPLEIVAGGAAVQAALANLKMAVEESGAVVTTDDLPTVEADFTALQQLFQNLIANAVKFRGDKRPEVHIGVEQRDAEWVFAVRDNGIGIDLEQYGERLFVVFQRLHTRQEYPGTGIGLAMCKKIVERHGGRIWVESEPGNGSTFCFTMPVLQEEEKVAPKGKQHAEA